MWQTLSSVIGKTNDKKIIIDSLRIDGEHVTDHLAIADGFCKYFSEVGPQISRNIETSALAPDMFMGPRSNGNIFLSPTDPEEVKEIISIDKYDAEEQKKLWP